MVISWLRSLLRNKEKMKGVYIIKNNNIFMVSYSFTKQRKKIYQLYVNGKDFRDIAKEIGISATRVAQIVARIKEKVSKTELDKIQK